MPDIEKLNYQIKNGIGEEIDVDCRFQDTPVAKPIVIFCHGFKGFKDWGGFPHMMQILAEAGFFAVSFNFSLNGVSKENPTEFTLLDNFAANTFSRELDDLGIVVNHIFEKAPEFNADNKRIGLIGHSRGGGIAILYTASDPRIRALAALASVSDFDRYGKELKKKWKEKGYLEVENTRTGQMMRLNITLLEDIEKNINRLDIKKAIAEINEPVLIVHGKEDLSVKYTEAVDLLESSDKLHTELLLVDNTGHTFGVVHPFKGTTGPFEAVIDRIIKFFKLNLRSI